jgi:anti-anti-sigma factor
MLAINIRQESNVIIVEVKGQIDGGPKSQEIQEIIKKAITEGNKNFIFDINDVKWINSMGAGVLIACYASARRNEGYINLVGVKDRVKVVLQTCGLIPTVFKEFESVKEAIEDFK